MRQALQSKLPDGLGAIAVRDDQEDLACSMNKLSRPVEQVMPNGLDRRALVTPRSHETFEARHQLKSQLATEKGGPVGVELPGRQLLQPKAAFMLLTKADVELAHFSDYLLSVHLLRASCRM